MKTLSFRIFLFPFAVALLHCSTTIAALAATQAGPNFVVNSVLDTDDGACDQPGAGTGNLDCTLREAIKATNSFGHGATISFNVSGTVVLTSALPQIGVSATVDGSGQAVTISGNDSVRGFTANSFAGSRIEVTFNALTLTRCRQAALLIGGEIAKVTNCTFVDNGTNDGWSGGAIRGTQWTSLTVANSTFFNNQAFEGGAISIIGAPQVGNPSHLAVYNSTFADNKLTHAFSQKGANIELYAATADFRNSIFLKDESKGAWLNCNSVGYVPSSHSQTFANDSSCNSAVATRAQIALDTLKNNGGSTQTMALLPGSVALNAADNSVASAAPVHNKDQRGYERIRPGDASSDAGAYESGASGSLVVSTTSDVVSSSDLGNSLREAFTYAQSLGGAQTITFAPALAAQTVTLSNGWSNEDSYRSSSALVVDRDITIQGSASAPGVTLKIADAAQLRHFAIAATGSLTLVNLTLTGGKALLANFNFGGSIWNFGSLNVRNCTFTSNTAGAEGGAVHSWGESPSLLIDNSTFSGNHSEGSAGAIVSGAVSMAFRHVTVTNNTAAHGHALFIYKYPLTMVNSLIAGNGSDSILSAIGGTFSGASTNNILGSATAPGLTNGVNGNQLGVPVAELNMGPLANNGGPTLTIALQPGSLAIDSGVAVPGLTADQRGTSRPQGPASDVGAFELLPTQRLPAPIFQPGSGVYLRSAQISISSPGPNTTVYYSVDGEPFHPYAGPFLVTKTQSIRAYASAPRGWLNSPEAVCNVVIAEPLQYWASVHQIDPAQQLLQNPSGDGIANVQKYAFNLAPNAGDLNKPNYQVLSPNGTAGLPLMTRDGEGRLVLEFVRRKASTNPGIVYLPETSADLLTWTPLGLENATVVSLDSVWERVTVADPAVTDRRFGRVVVTTLGAYYNGFEFGQGPCDAFGDIWFEDGKAVMTDGSIGGQIHTLILKNVDLGNTFTAEPTELTGFTARFNLQLGPGTQPPADGLSFAVGQLNRGTRWGEAGPGTSHSLAVGFDTYDNGGDGSIGIHIWVNGLHVAASPVNPYTNGAVVPVEITWEGNSALTVKYNGVTIFDHLPISGFQLRGDSNGYSRDELGFGARAGAAAERAVIDEVRIEPRF